MHMRKFLCMLMAFMLTAFSVFAQNKTVTGMVTDDKGAPIQGVSVTLKGTKTGVMTDADGSYRIEVPSTAKHCLLMLASKPGNRQSVARFYFHSTRSKNLDEVVLAM
ncbi:MAG: carboxypeptidase regulatory-like domain-containing protein [Chitinophagaceae bacterium]|nr:carboxypeptidase regulatory-like domain-containing protein [Chitinophagaceae bacterium]